MRTQQHCYKTSASAGWYRILVRRQTVMLPAVSYIRRPESIQVPIGVGTVPKGLP